MVDWVQRKAIVSDFDNTLFFTDRCTYFASKEMFGKPMGKKELRALPKEVKIKTYYLAYSKYDKYAKPNVRMKSILSKGNKMDKIILTARFKDLKARTLKLLKKNGINFDKVIFRQLKYKRMPDEEWKRMSIKELSKEYDQINFYEDKSDNIEYISDRIVSKNINYFLVGKGSIRKIG